VDDKGVVTAHSAGSATILVTTVDGSKSATCAVTVEKALPPPPPLDIVTCNNTATPGWGENLGTVSFATTQEWTISGHGVAQIWSDAVQATNCNKTSFSGGPEGNFNSDCRSNPDQKGDLFSWCAVVRFQETLCPDPWRVPTRQDFCDLDRALTGVTTCMFRENPAHRDAFLNVWGGTYAGRSSENGTIGIFQGQVGSYWSQSVRDGNANRGHLLEITIQNYLAPQDSALKNIGFSLRCVR
jgi:uncharacterized protein (TIGR02145 family)